MRGMKSLRLGLLVIGGWAIAPITWANPSEASAETGPSAVQSKEMSIAAQTDAKRTPATTVNDWMAQIEASLVQITGVRLEETETGLQVILYQFCIYMT